VRRKEATIRNLTKCKRIRATPAILLNLFFLKPLQEKTATKVRRKEATIRNLTTECERIRAKGAHEELTAGQAATLARNERTIDVLKEEVCFWTHSLYRHDM